MKKLLILLLICSCSNEQRIVENGFMSIRAAYTPYDTTKICNGLEPAYMTFTIKQRYEDAIDFVAPVRVGKGGIETVVPIEVLPGKYVVTDVKVYSITGEITHKVVDLTDGGWDYSKWVVAVTPFNTNVYQTKETIIGLQLFCW